MLLMPEPAAIDEVTLHQARSEQDLIALVKKAKLEKKKIAVTASKNSSKEYRKLAENKHSTIQIDLLPYNRVLKIDSERKQITVQAGITQGDLIEAIRPQGWALRALNGSHHLTLGGLLVSGSFCAARYTFNEAVVSMTVITAEGQSIRIDRDQHPQVFGAYLTSLGLLGILSTITLQCVDEFYVRGNASVIGFDQMLELKDNEGKDFLKDWDYLVCEWYPFLNQFITRRSVRSNRQANDKKNQSKKSPSTVGPKESYLAQLLTVVANVFPFIGPFLSKLYLKYLGTEFSDGLWDIRICADPKMDLAFHPIDYIEIVLPQEKYKPYMLELKEFYRKNPGNRPYCPVISDWIIADSVSWIGKNSERSVLESSPATSAQNSSNWFCAITVMHQHVEKKSAQEIFEGPVRIAKKYGARMHWGKKPWMSDLNEIAATLPNGNFEMFAALRAAADPEGLFLNPFFEQLFGTPSPATRPLETSTMLSAP